MNRFLDIFARVIVGVLIFAMIGLLGHGLYQHPEVMFPLVGVVAGIVVVAWAIERVAGVGL